MDTVEKILGSFTQYNGMNSIKQDQLLAKLKDSTPETADYNTTQLLDILHNICYNLKFENYYYLELADKIFYYNIRSKVLESIYLCLGYTTNTVADAFIELTKKLTQEKYLSISYCKRVLDYEEVVRDLLVSTQVDLIKTVGYDLIYNKYATRYPLPSSQHTMIDTPIETIEFIFMRVAISLSKTANQIRDIYKNLCKFCIMFGTPILVNAGKITGQLCSCFVLELNDSIKSITACYRDAGLLLASMGGVATHLTEIRCKGQRIKSCGAPAAGISSIVSVINQVSKAFNENKRRTTLSACYLETWHAEFEMMLDFVEPHHQLDKVFFGVWRNDEFMRCVKHKQPWYFMSPDDCPDLVEAYDEEFQYSWIDQPDPVKHRFTWLYRKYIQQGKYRYKIDNAGTLYRDLLHKLLDRGRPYICNKDAINRSSNHKNLGTIKSSNLCTEITEYKDKNHTAVCNIESIVLPYLVKNGKMNYKKLRKMVHIAIQAGNNIIDMNHYLTNASRRGNHLTRPIGLGVQGLAEVFTLYGYSFDDPQAKDLSEEILEAIYYYALEESCRLASMYGTYPAYKGSPISQGIFHFEMIDYKHHGLSQPKLVQDWELLRANILKHGVRNSLMVALMPTSSTSVITGVTPCFEPYGGMIYKRKIISGEFIMVNHYLAKDLISRGQYTSDILYKIIESETGGISHIQEIDPDIRHKYKSAYEIDPISIVDHNIKRTPFVDQSQSTNLFLNSSTAVKNLQQCDAYSWRSGAKTSSYYVRVMMPSTNQRLYMPTCKTCSG